MMIKWKLHFVGLVSNKLSYSHGIVGVCLFVFWLRHLNIQMLVFPEKGHVHVWFVCDKEGFVHADYVFFFSSQNIFYLLHCIPDLLCRL